MYYTYFLYVLLHLLISTVTSEEMCYGESFKMPEKHNYITLEKSESAPGT